MTAEGVLAVLAEKPRWMALYRGGVELNALGYSRQPITTEDWSGGDIGTQTFGPAAETWVIDAVQLMTAVGEEIVTAAITPVGVDVGQEFLFDMRIEARG